MAWATDLGVNACALPIELVDLPARVERYELDAGLPEWDHQGLLGDIQGILTLHELVEEVVGEGLETLWVLLGIPGHDP